MSEHWSSRAPAMLLADGGPDGEPCPTPADRRWLWRLENFLAISATTDLQRQMQRDLTEYLRETCSHHWRHWVGDADIPAHRQCLWCNDVEWEAGDVS